MHSLTGSRTTTEGHQKYSTVSRMGFYRSRSFCNTVGRSTYVCSRLVLFLVYFCLSDPLTISYDWLKSPAKEVRERIFARLAKPFLRFATFRVAPLCTVAMVNALMQNGSEPKLDCARAKFRFARCHAATIS